MDTANPWAALVVLPRKISLLWCKETLGWKAAQNPVAQTQGGGSCSCVRWGLCLGEQASSSARLWDWFPVQGEVFGLLGLQRNHLFLLLLFRTLPGVLSWSEPAFCLEWRSWCERWHNRENQAGLNPSHLSAMCDQLVRVRVGIFPS